MIQWYPGHMAKAIREIEEKVKLVDLVIVLLDSRIPYSSFNPLIKEKIKNKRTLYLLTKSDLAIDAETKKWVNYYTENDNHALSVNLKEKSEFKKIIKYIDEIMADKVAKDLSRGLKARPIRSMVVGIPNVGKSTFINGLVNKKVAQVGDKPGVTKNQQWIRIHERLELIDTPGVLWPKFENQTIGLNLAVIGSIKDDILKIEDVASYALEKIKDNKELIEKRYNIELSYNYPLENLDLIGNVKNFKLNNNSIDYNRVSHLVLNDLRNGYLGKITLETVSDINERNN